MRITHVEDGGGKAPGREPGEGPGATSGREKARGRAAARPRVGQSGGAPRPLSRGCGSRAASGALGSARRRVHATQDHEQNSAPITRRLVRATLAASGPAQRRELRAGRSPHPARPLTATALMPPGPPGSAAGEHGPGKHSTPTGHDEPGPPAQRNALTRGRAGVRRSAVRVLRDARADGSLPRRPRHASRKRHAQHPRVLSDRARVNQPSGLLLARISGRAGPASSLRW